MNNFRQFYDENEIVFSIDPKQKVTLVHAENTFGKTTALNAILFCFHEQFTPAFQNPNFIINKEAYAEGKRAGYCEVTFIHQEKDEESEYIVHRSFDQKSREDFNSTVHFFRVVEGESVRADNYQRFIEAVVPKDIAKYFFFDGEGAEAFYQNTPQQKKKNETAIRDIIGCQFLEWTRDDFSFLAKKYQKEYNSLASKEAGSRELANKISELESEISALEKKVEQSDTLINATSDQIKKLNENLATIKVVQDIAEKRIRTKRNLKRERDGLEKLKGEKLKWIGQFAYSYFVEELCQTAALEFDQKDKRAEIPEKYSEPFIQGLLEDQLCICGRPLSEHGEEFNQVKSLIDTSSDDAMITNYNSARQFISGNGIVKRNGDEKYRNLQLQIKEQEDRIANLEQDEKNDEQDFEAVDDRAVRKLRDDLREAESQLTATQNKAARYRTDIEILKTSLKEKQRELNTIGGVGLQTSTIQEKIKLAEEMAEHTGNRLKNMLGVYRKNVQRNLNEKISPAMPAQEKIIIEDDFSFLLLDHRDEKDDLSSGQGICCSLAYTAFLIQISKLNVGSVDKPGTIAPMVLDAPFSKLDEYLGPKTSEVITTSSEQLIIFVNTKDYKFIKHLIEELIGKRYVLLREVVVVESEVNKTIDRTLRLDDFEQRLITYEQPRDRTRVMDIN